MLLSLQRISKRHRGARGSRPALLDVSLEVRRGQVVGVFGPSGAGKTTLLQIAAGLQTPDEGAVLYEGQRLDRLSSAERLRLRRREIACVWGAQPPQRGLSALDHVLVPLLLDRRERRSAARVAHEALEACEAGHCAAAGLHELSDGERQRVDIARALAIEPKLLLADGPASSLSLVEQEAIMALLASLAREARVGVLIADGDIETLIGAETILCLAGGRLLDAQQPARGRLYRFPDRSRTAAADG